MKALFEETLAQFVDARLARVHVSMPGSVVSFDGGTQRATVDIDVAQAFKDGKRQSFPRLSSVPVLFQRGGGYGAAFALEHGDRVWILFSERSLDEWKSTTGKASPQDPRRFDLSDAVCLPVDARGSLGVAQGTAWVGETEAAGRRLTFAQNGIRLGTSSADVLTILDDLMGALQTATAGGQPLDPGTLATLTALRASLATVKQP